MCTCVCQRWHAGTEIVFSVCVADITVGQHYCIQQPGDASANMNALLNLYPAFLLPCVSLHPINLPHRQSSTRRFYDFTAQPQSFVSFTFLPSALKPVSLAQKSAFESGVPGRAQLSETVGFMMRWRVSLLENGFKESRAF